MTQPPANADSPIAGEGDFSALLAELEAVQAGNADLSKAMKADDDAKIAAAAKDAGIDGAGDGKANNEKDGDDDGKGDDDEDEYFGKSFTVELPDGTTTEAFDGTEAIRRLHYRLDEQGEQLTKALTTVTSALRSSQALVAEQAELIKSLRADVHAIASAPAGRKAVLSVHEKPGPAAPAQPEGLTREDVLSKALTANKAGRISSLDVSRIESAINSGRQPAADLLARIA